MLKEQFDFIVIGSGSAGGVVAARLSEIKSFNVLLIEAGTDAKDVWLNVPLGFGKVHADPRFTWGYQARPDANLNGRSLPWQRGKILGGSSAINGLVYMRGHPADYDGWAEGGAEGWRYKDVLPFFRKSERYALGECEFHGASGPIGVEYPRWRNELSAAFIESAAGIGIERNADFCGESLDGAGRFHLTAWKGRRSSVAATYLKEARRRPNLTILTNAQVTRILIRGGAAVGVDFYHNGQRQSAFASLEVVLSAGAINTPQLLELSGIGDAARLASLGIAVVKDLPGVGENMSDHMFIKRVFETSSRATINHLIRSPIHKSLAAMRYMLSRSGPLAIGAATAGAFVHTRPGLEAPDVQLSFHPFAPAQGLNLLAPYSGFHISVGQNRPESRGSVHIRSANPYEQPVIRANYLASEVDRRATIEGLRIVKHIVKATPLAPLVLRETEPSCIDESDTALLEYVRANCYTAWHHCGTARMGHGPGTVVDPQLRVHGLRQLRIADGSIMPSVISGNTNAACIMIGERAADFIVSQYR